MRFEKGGILKAWSNKKKKMLSIDHIISNFISIGKHLWSKVLSFPTCSSSRLYGCEPKSVSLYTRSKYEDTKRIKELQENNRIREETTDN